MMKLKNNSLLYFLFYLIGISLSIILSSCSDVNKNNITAAPELTIHTKGVLDKQSPYFHGKLLLNETMESCKQCHSSNFSGGIAKVGCNTIQCHPAINVHMEGIITVGSNNFHGTYIKDSNWNLAQCSQCHGTNFSGGIVSPSCTKCHTNSGGPEACNTCHGDFNNPDRIAPPRDINGDTSTTVLGVGAHTKHLYETTIGNQVSCSNCHKVPQNLDSPGHVDSGLPAEVTLSGQAVAHGASNASYNHADGSCANTYCHGNFTFYKDSTSLRNQFAYTADKITGISHSVVWNKVDGSQIECGSCHGLPPAGHITRDITLKDCAGCHVGVVDEFGNIIDKTKHMNGKIDVFGEEE